MLRNISFLKPTCWRCFFMWCKIRACKWTAAHTKHAWASWTRSQSTMDCTVILPKWWVKNYLFPSLMCYASVLIYFCLVGLLSVENVWHRPPKFLLDYSVFLLWVFSCFVVHVYVNRCCTCFGLPTLFWKFIFYSYIFIVSKVRYKDDDILAGR